MFYFIARDLDSGVAVAPCDTWLNIDTLPPEIFPLLLTIILGSIEYVIAPPLVKKLLLCLDHPLVMLMVLLQLIICLQFGLSSIALKVGEESL